MKNLLLPIALLITSFSQAQQITIVTEQMSMGAKEGLSLTVKDIDEKFLDNTWKSYIKKYGGKYKWDRRAKEHRNEGSTIPNISNDLINVYAVSRSNANGSELIIWLEENERFLTSTNDSIAFDNAANLLNHFNLEVHKEKTLEDIKSEEKNLSRLENDLKKLERQNEKLLKDIENYKSRIAKAEQDIIDNEKEQVSSSHAIKKQNETLEELKKKLSEY